MYGAECWTLLSGPRWRKHQLDNTGILPLSEDDKNGHRCLSAMDDNCLEL
jgi:hypothetical protein